MTLRIDVLTIDARDPRTIAAWWQEALGYRAGDGDGGDEVEILAPEGSDHQPGLLFIRVPEGKSVKNRLHLDLRPDDQAAEVARLEAMGATRVDIGQGDETWVVLADPEGNEFCVLRARPG
jgi:catechol 2,3-dioxygenase-like lactoylglutathione lyase family enzyme